MMDANVHTGQGFRKFAVRKHFIFLFYFITKDKNIVDQKSNCESSKVTEHIRSGSGRGSVGGGGGGGEKGKYEEPRGGKSRFQVLTSTLYVSPGKFKTATIPAGNPLA